MNKKIFQRGISLYLAIIVLAIVLAAALGLAAILVGQIKIIRGMGNSVVAFYAADTGIEQVLKEVIDCIKELEDTGSWCSGLKSRYPDEKEEKLDNGASYWVKVVCCDSTSDECQLDKGTIPPCPLGSESEDCHATYFCIRSVGTYRGTQRAIEVKIFPPQPPESQQ